MLSERGPNEPHDRGAREAGRSGGSGHPARSRRSRPSSMHSPPCSPRPHGGMATTDPAVARLVEGRRRVAFVGLGSSRDASIAAAWLLRSRGIDATVHMPSEIPRSLVPDALVVAVSASGATSSVLEAIDRLDSAGRDRRGHARRRRPGRRARRRRHGSRLRRGGVGHRRLVLPRVARRARVPRRGARRGGDRRCDRRGPARRGTARDAEAPGGRGDRRGGRPRPTRARRARRGAARETRRRPAGGPGAPRGPAAARARRSPPRTGITRTRTSRSTPATWPSCRARPRPTTSCVRWVTGRDRSARVALGLPLGLEGGAGGAVRRARSVRSTADRVPARRVDGPARVGSRDPDGTPERRGAGGDRLRR